MFIVNKLGQDRNARPPIHRGIKRIFQIKTDKVFLAFLCSF